jgi:hypothetical protein
MEHCVKLIPSMMQVLRSLECIRFPARRGSHGMTVILACLLLFCILYRHSPVVGSRNNRKYENNPLEV